ncbi:unnamed protein product, partial [Polarella glacialis]
RNLETMIADANGPERHNEHMLQLRDAILNHCEEDPVLMNVRKMLRAVRMPPDRQDQFMLESINGRFGVDWNKHV